MTCSRLTTAYAILGLSGLFAWAQTVDFNQNRTFATVADRKVYDAYGNLLVGTNYVALLYYGPYGTDPGPALCR
jgi:hypothetical protein